MPHGAHGLGAGQVGDRWAAALRKVLRRAFLTRTAYEWESILGAAGVPGTAHRTTVEWLCSRHAREAGLVETADDGSLRPGPLVWVEEGRVAHGRAEGTAHGPQAGLQAGPPSPADPSRSSSHPSATATPTSTATSDDHWLKGIEVVDLANVIAGPTIGSMLARFGARVTKIDAPRPSYSPDTTVIYGACANLGKRACRALPTPCPRR